MPPPPALSLTLAILKPDLVLHPRNLALVRRAIVDHQFWVVRSDLVRLTRRQASEFYSEHLGKFFHRRLVEHMTSGPCQPLVLAREGAIQEWREVMGPTKVFRSSLSHPSSLRGRFGLTDTRNCCHGSDSPETAAREMGFFFPTFCPSSFLSSSPHQAWVQGLPMDWQLYQHSSPWSHPLEAPH